MTTGINPYEADTHRDHASPRTEQEQDEHAVCNNSSCVYNGQAGRSKAALRASGSAQSKQYGNGARNTGKPALGVYDATLLATLRQKKAGPQLSRVMERGRGSEMEQRQCSGRLRLGKKQRSSRSTALHACPHSQGKTGSNSSTTRNLLMAVGSTQDP